MRLKNKLLHSWLGHQIDFKHKLLNLILIITLIGGFITLVVSWIAGMSLVGNIMLGSYLLVSVFCFILANYVHKPRMAAIIILLLFDVIGCPMMFFQYGGLHSGFVIWTVLGLAAPWFTLEGTACLVIYLLGLIPNSAAIIISYLHPELVKPMESEFLLMIDVLSAFMLVSFITGIVYMFQTKEYEKQRMILQRQEETLHQALENTAAANRAKSNFLATMSHDIRTPLNAIIGFTRIAEKNIEDKEKLMECLQKTKASSDYLLTLINDVLDMSRIESGHMSLELKPCNLEDAVIKMQELFSQEIKAKNIEFSVEMPTVKNIYVLCDVLRMNQIVSNLLSNAVKYTNDYGKIKLIIKQTSGVINGKADYQLKVEDNGIGMTKEFQKIIFQAYSREMSNISSGAQGSGLGMAITKAIVDLMGGKISVISQLGQGTVFTVDLSLTIIEKEHFEEPPKDVIYYFDGKKILLAEDNELNREIATAILREYGITPEIAKNGMEAFDMVRDSESGYYDAVLMDIQMPIMNGYEATQAIRDLEDEKNKAVPIIAMTAHAFEDDREMAVKCGMNGHVAKPIEIPKLMNVLNSILS